MGHQDPKDSCAAEDAAGRALTKPISGARLQCPGEHVSVGKVHVVTGLLSPRPTLLLLANLASASGRARHTPADPTTCALTHSSRLC